MNFSNEVIGFIKKIQEDMNENWEKVHKSLANLNKTIEDSLDSLLTGINPEGIKETSKSLKDIMDTMGKSMQSMNLENIMRELRVMAGGEIALAPAPKGKEGKAVPLKTGLSTPYGSPSMHPPIQQQQEMMKQLMGLSPEEIAAYKEAYGGELPPHLKKKQKKKKDSHLLKPSDFFGM